MDNLEIELLQKDEYYLFYEMMILALKTDNVLEGINKSLLLLKTYLNCGDIVLHKKSEDGNYVFSISHSGMKHLIEPISVIVNRTSRITERKGKVDLNVDLSKDIRNLKLFYLKTDNHEYILSLNNIYPKKSLNPTFFIQMQDTMQVILKRAEMYEKNIMAIKMDLLTGLDNRNSYELAIEEINKSNAELVFAIFDLFRLKNINDKYGHVAGDTYIREAAKVLKNYWPKNNIERIKGSEIITETGHCVYRTGGDEFVLITTKENVELVNTQAELAAEEVSMLDLGIPLDPVEDIIGLNYGVVEHSPSSSIKETYKNADQLLYENKSKMYVLTGLDRRH